MRICIDLDGVVAELKLPGQAYEELKPVPGAAEKIRQLRHQGHYIILFTARHMKTCNGNIGQVMNRIGLVTLQWLDKCGIEYDEIFFGKPWADVYIDDNGIRFDTWSNICDDGSNLPISREEKFKETHL
jgi:capsule biosynthesis phosphatase